MNYFNISYKPPSRCKPFYKRVKLFIIMNIEHALLQKWGAIHQPESLWDLKNEINSLHFTDFTIKSICKHHVSLLVNIIQYYNLLY